MEKFHVMSHTPVAWISYWTHNDSNEGEPRGSATFGISRWRWGVWKIDTYRLLRTHLQFVSRVHEINTTAPSSFRNGMITVQRRVWHYRHSFKIQQWWVRFQCAVIRPLFQSRISVPMGTNFPNTLFSFLSANFFWHDCIMVEWSFFILGNWCLLLSLCSTDSWITPSNCWWWRPLGTRHGKI